MPGCRRISTLFLGWRNATGRLRNGRKVRQTYTSC
jgi:hypothetical protein